MSLPDDARIEVSFPADLAEQALADMEEWGRRAPLSFRRLVGHVRTARDRAVSQAPAAAEPDKAPSERPVSS
jgi:hypothetical protein